VRKRDTAIAFLCWLTSPLRAGNGYSGRNWGRQLNGDKLTLFHLESGH